jgi:CheY-like chemotaxis protein
MLRAKSNQEGGKARRPVGSLGHQRWIRPPPNSPLKNAYSLRSPGVEDTLVDAGYSVMISDVRMPGMSGIALAEEAVRRRPNLRVILISGFIARTAVYTNYSSVATEFGNQNLAPKLSRRNPFERSDQAGR